MKFTMKVAAVFMAPLIGFCWVYALGEMAMYLWEWSLPTALFVAASVTMIQIMFVSFAFDAGFIKKNPGEKE
jgi:hypothetical protein